MGIIDKIYYQDSNVVDLKLETLTRFQSSPPTQEAAFSSVNWRVMDATKFALLSRTISFHCVLTLHEVGVGRWLHVSYWDTGIHPATIVDPMIVKMTGPG